MATSRLREAMHESWRDVIAGDRLAVDQEFEDRVRQAGLSPQEWGLVMTAVEIRVEDPGAPEEAELVADTSRLDSVLPQIEAVRNEIGAAGPGDRDDGGLLDGVRRALGLGGHEETRETAETLAAEYADRLQARLQEEGRWGDVCALAAAE